MPASSACRIFGLLLALFPILFAEPLLAEESTPVAVIVHPERDEVLSSEDISQIYLRRRRFWNDGSPIVPLNLSSGATAREHFSISVLRWSGSRLATYWNQQYARGILPPSTLASFEAVRRYVAADRNAIGYVPVDEVDGSVRVLLEID